jgi:hypothetical protein
MGLFPAFVLLDQVEAREDDFIVFLLSSTSMRRVSLGGDGGCADGIGVHMLVVGTGMSRTSGGSRGKRQSWGAIPVASGSLRRRGSRGRRRKWKRLCGRGPVGVIMVGW